jgi:hypothetical protein
MKDGWAFVSRCDAPARGGLEGDFTVKQSFVGNQRSPPVLCVERAEIRSALTQGARIVSDLLRSRGGAGALPCPRCRAAMDEVVTIAPVAGEPGLTAYDCPNCGYVTSVLEPPRALVHRA